MKYYKKPDMSLWKGRIDSQQDETAFRWHQVINHLNLDLSDYPKIECSQDVPNGSFVIIGFCSDVGVKRNEGRAGSHKGPVEIKKTLAGLPVHFDNKTQVFDAGNVICPDKKLETAQEVLSKIVQHVLKKNLVPVVIGGGHELAFAHGQGIYAHHRKKTIGIINFDAHFDLRPIEGGLATSGTPFLQLSEICIQENRPFHYMCLGIQRQANTLSLFDTALRLGTTTVMSDEMNLNNTDLLKGKVDRFVETVDLVYLTVCLDVFSSAFAPGVSAASPTGINPDICLALIKHLVKTGKVASFDVAELSPTLDRDNQTTKLAAHLVNAFIVDFPKSAAKIKTD